MTETEFFNFLKITKQEELIGIGFSITTGEDVYTNIITKILFQEHEEYDVFILVCFNNEGKINYSWVSNCVSNDIGLTLYKLI